LGGESILPKTDSSVQQSTLQHSPSLERPFDEFRARLAGYGRWTYRAAWALEIAAAIIGLGTGLILGYQAASATDNVEAMALVLASAPFFMVALAELTKIPIATLLFSASWKWRPILAVFLFSLAFITFETVFFGLERAATLRQLEIEQFTARVSALTGEQQSIASSMKDILSARGPAAAQENYERINKLAEAERQSIQKLIDEHKKELTESASSTPQIEAAKRAVIQRQDRRRKLVGERDAEIEAAVTQFENQRDSFVERMNGSNVPPALMRRWADELAALRNPRPGIIDRYKQQLNDLDEEIESLQSKLDLLALESTELSDLQRSNWERRRDDLIAQRDATILRWSAALGEARQGLEDAQKREGLKAQTLESHRIRQETISSDLAALKSKMVPIARQDQIRRFAGRIFGKNPEDVSVDEANIIAVVWFGSLAILAALAGPITAIVALGLQRVAASDNRKVDGRLKHLLRRLLLSWRWKRVRTVEVPVEVPIEKEVEVEKRVEVPVEKVIKEILYLPVLTDDPNETHRLLSQDIPSEIADLIKVKAKGGSNGSQT
jgi:hypothetical protein